MNTEVKVTRVLSPTDFSPGAEPALRWASSIAKAFGAALVLLHVLDLNIAAMAGLPPSMGMMTMTEDLLKQMRSEANAEMERLSKSYPDAKVLVREGSPRPAILEVAEELKADMIVMGTHGRTGLAHVFFGSVAEHVVRNAKVPVLTVRQSE
jgi:nucleotide-binding universal stress UspA family protein